MGKLTIQDCLNLQLEVLRDNMDRMPPDVRTSVALQILGRAFKHLAKYRNKGDNEARKELRLSAQFVCQDAMRETLEQMKKWGFTSNQVKTISTKKFRVPFTYA